jgi:hypothetical protein
MNIRGENAPNNWYAPNNCRLNKHDKPKEKKKWNTSAFDVDVVVALKELYTQQSLRDDAIGGTAAPALSVAV